MGKLLIVWGGPMGKFLTVWGGPIGKFFTVWGGLMERLPADGREGASLPISQVCLDHRSPRPPWTSLLLNSSLGIIAFSLWCLREGSKLPNQ